MTRFYFITFILLSLVSSGRIRTHSGVCFSLCTLWSFLLLLLLSLFFSFALRLFSGRFSESDVGINQAMLHMAPPQNFHTIYLIINKPKRNCPIVKPLAWRDGESKSIPGIVLLLLLVLSGYSLSYEPVTYG
ncbi:uncharacterized protein BDCG_16328 [Blastomyces dermatitidis ER-3]|uniref:Uncharacterized protein n=2 Tax=Blastomyces TaxID=229219 RepID=A0A179UEN6_BLAGS|nr:uncharacterized protein BDBG_16641 [Blastomyces gilchristii SLH14081]XP_045279540.1 uncharacterized protein BDCG_16328 [Blastomyces dermatitidis ER-3]EQL32059.1 hypothetical protein BDFG_05721 [Blastomyces dermatitidis ATCC 26199]OAS99812.1 hypothetical protein BDCG_16328 [Blastomyces dermatitidis ER-3]OAT06485.1 hypothetical protein BDBG_16641 [Blastomyces gilchristii SLH14081]